MKNKKTAVVAVLVAVGIATLGLAAAVYAKYVSTITRTGSAKVAKWAFTSDNTSGDITCVLDYNYDTDTLVSGRIAPGTSGKCPIVISNENSEVGVDYKISLPSTITGQPAHMKFYADAGHTIEMTSSAPIEGSLAAKTASSEPVYVYWVWPYEGSDPSATAYDATDTSDGEAAASLSIEFTITGTQVQPATN